MSGRAHVPHSTAGSSCCQTRSGSEGCGRFLRRSASSHTVHVLIEAGMRRVDQNRWFLLYPRWLQHKVLHVRRILFVNVPLGRDGTPVDPLGGFNAQRAAEGPGVSVSSRCPRWEPWWAGWCSSSAGRWSPERRTTRSPSSWRASAWWCATPTRPRTGRLRPPRSASRCAPPTPRWRSPQSGATTTSLRRWATKPGSSTSTRCFHSFNNTDVLFI